MTNTDRVAQFLKANPGRPMHVQVVAHELGLTPTQVGAAWHYVQSREGFRRVKTGTYVYQEPSPVETTERTSRDRCGLNREDAAELFSNVVRLSTQLEILSKQVERQWAQLARVEKNIGLLVAEFGVKA